MKYTIQRGKQHASPLFFGFEINQYPRLSYRCSLTESCQYNLVGNPDTMEGDDFDINKLVGFGFLNFHKLKPHHWDSVRVGWVWNSEKKLFDLYGYCYIEGERQKQLLLSVPTGIPFDVEITSSKTYYFVEVSFHFEGQRRARSVLFNRKKVRWVPYLLGPYFGGDQNAPHDVHLFLTDLTD